MTTTPEEFKKKMEEIYCTPDGYDAEGAHADADKLMCNLLMELGYVDGALIFKTAEKWYA